MDASHPPASAFVTTRWTRVLSARGNTPEAREALSDLCAAYYEPVLAFIRRGASHKESARDLAQEFFARVLAHQGFDTVHPGKGRFRSFLLGAVKHFLADMGDQRNAVKRGGGATSVPIEANADTDVEIQIADVDALRPDREFDRKWALTVLDRALTALSEEHKAAGKELHFETLKPWLTGDTELLSQADAAARLGVNEGAAKVAIHRLRRRFRELVKAEVGQTLSDPSQVANELACLVEALGQK